MSDPFYGEIRMFAGAYAPQNWAQCDGQVMQISDNSTLYSLLGTTYGGDGVRTFALPDLRGRLPLNQGQGAGLTSRLLGQSFGTETVTLLEAQLPSHNHPMRASTDTATASTPSAAVVLATPVTTAPSVAIYGTTTDATKIHTLASDAVQNTGGSQYHTNLMPALCINFIICLLGIYPDRP